MREGLSERQDVRRASLGGWRRMLALWGFAPVPFFKAFEGEEAKATRLAWVEDHLRAAKER